MKTFNEIVLTFLPVESKRNILYVNINFIVYLFFRFGWCWGKVVPEPAISYPFRVLALTSNVLSIFFSCTHLANDIRNNVFVMLHWFWNNFYIFFINMSCFGSNLFFEDRKLLIIMTFAQQCLLYKISRQTGKPFW